MSTQDKDGSARIIRWLVLALVAVFGAWLVSPAVLQYFYDGNMSERGQAGDQFGAVNSLFAGLAFAVLIGTLLLQRQELEYQREELRATRREFELTRQEHEKANEALAKQSFENTFFQMIRLHHDIVNSLDMGSPDLKGRRCFERVYTDLVAAYTGERRDNTRLVDVNSYRNYIEKFLNKREDMIAHYLNNLICLIEFVDNSDIDAGEKYFYFNVIRAQLSTHEMMIVFYYSITHKAINLKLLIEKYRLLAGLPTAKFVSTGHDPGFYTNDSLAPL